MLSTGYEQVNRATELLVGLIWVIIGFVRLGYGFKVVFIPIEFGIKVLTQDYDLTYWQAVC
jgi:hypothetical protein